MIRFYRQDLGDYMERWILVHPWGTVRLHHILRGDADPDPHDHPWSFVSIILAGSYLEEVWTEVPPTGSGRWPAYANDGRWLSHWVRPLRFWPRYVPAARLHRLRLDAPVWTLVFTGNRVRRWGFATKGGWVPWKEYTSQKEGFDQAAYEAQLRAVYGRRS